MKRLSTLLLPLSAMISLAASTKGFAAKAATASLSFDWLIEYGGEQEHREHIERKRARL